MKGVAGYAELFRPGEEAGAGSTTTDEKQNLGHLLRTNRPWLNPSPPRVTSTEGILCEQTEHTTPPTDG